MTQLAFIHQHPAYLRRGQLTLALCLLAACLVGIFSRPIGYLAAFWPANAIMLGLLLRHPGWAQAPSSWVLSWCTYVAADLLTGSSLVVALSMNTANVAGVLAAWAYLSRHGLDVLRFQRQRSVLVLLVGSLLGAAGGAALGGPAGTYSFGLPMDRSIGLWLSAEFYSFILITPLFLAAPQGWVWQWRWPQALQPVRWSQALPLLALIGSEVLSLWLGGPGALAFIMPAMVWCAMAYGVFPITVLSLVVCSWKTAAIALGAFSFTPEHIWEFTSFRTGMALLSLAPLAVAGAYALRMQALQKLNHAVNHDYLTGVLARRALMLRGQKLLGRLQAERQPVAVLMLDIDHFKQVNDRHGHAQGDVVLQEFAVLARDHLRPDDLIGRMGGEEFAVILPRTQREQAMAIGQRLCEKLRAHRFPLPNHAQLQATVSVGLHAVQTIGPQDTLEHMLSKADAALYQAKNGGRDQVQQYGPAMAPTSI